MHSAGQFLRIKHAGFDVLAMKVGARVGRRIAVKGKIAGLGANQYFIAMQFPGLDHLA